MTILQSAAGFTNMVPWDIRLSESPNKTLMNFLFATMNIQQPKSVPT